MRYRNDTLIWLTAIVALACALLAGRAWATEPMAPEAEPVFLQAAELVGYWKNEHPKRIRLSSDTMQLAVWCVTFAEQYDVDLRLAAAVIPYECDCTWKSARRGHVGWWQFATHTPKWHLIPARKCGYDLHDPKANCEWGFIYIAERKQRYGDKLTQIMRPWQPWNDGRARREYHRLVKAGRFELQD